MMKRSTAAYEENRFAEILRSADSAQDDRKSTPFAESAQDKIKSNLFMTQKEEVAEEEKKEHRFAEILRFAQDDREDNGEDGRYKTYSRGGEAMLSQEIRSPENRQPAPSVNLKVR